MGESACEAGACADCGALNIETLCEERVKLRARVAELEAAIRAWRRVDPCDGDRSCSLTADLALLAPEQIACAECKAVRVLDLLMTEKK